MYLLFESFGIIHPYGLQIRNYLYYSQNEWQMILSFCLYTNSQNIIYPIISKGKFICSSLVCKKLIIYLRFTFRFEDEVLFRVFYVKIYFLSWIIDKISYSNEGRDFSYIFKEFLSGIINKNIHWFRMILELLLIYQMLRSLLLVLPIWILLIPLRLSDYLLA